MTRQIPVITSSLVFAVMLLLLLDRANGEFRHAPKTQTVASNRVVVDAARRGNPSINLADGIELAAEYAGDLGAQLRLQGGTAEPRALTSGDFDEDGVPDLLCAYSSPGGGVLTLHRGNIDSIYPNSPAAKQRKANGLFSDSAFLSPAQVFELSDSGDFIAAGDFDADGHWDVATAARGGSAIYLYSGDGKGGVATGKRIELPGLVAALASGDINRPDGMADIVVAVTTDESSKALVFEGPEGALESHPEVFDLPSESSAISVGRFDGDYLVDFVVAAGRDLVTVKGRDRKLSQDRIRQAEVEPAEVERQSFGFDIVSIAAGDFTTDHEMGLALLASDGMVYTAGIRKLPTSKKAKGKRAYDVQAVGQWSGASQLVKARVSAGRADDVLVLERGGHQLRIVSGNGSKAASEALSERAITSLDLKAPPITALAMRLNSDALSDLVIFESDQTAPTVVKTAPNVTFTVNKTDDHDDGICDSGDCTLREAINAANASAGSDMIAFNIPGSGVHTIAPTSALPDITGPVTIDGTTQPGFVATPVIELSGNGQGINGLTLTGGDSMIRGLAVNRFDGLGAAVFSDNNVFEGNFVGTDSTGTIGAHNHSGVSIIDGSNNLVGGTTTSARNLISNNSFGGIAIVRFAGMPSNNLVQGNYVGTDVTGTVGLFNGATIGVQLEGQNNTLGGTTPGTRNLISGNGHNGVRIQGSGNVMQGNFVGTDVNGIVEVPNLGMGVAATDEVTVGGTTPAARNLISGNRRTGVHLEQGVLVQGNFIGTDVTGTSELGNFESGVRVEFFGGNVIGGTSDGAGNLISGNGGNGFGGVDLSGDGNFVQGNLIGTDVTGSLAIPNIPFGVSVSGSNNWVGGTDPGARNVVSGNTTGIQIGGSILPGPGGNIVQGNLIGTDGAGTAAVGNSHGLGITSSFNNTIGGTDDGAGNVIAFNTSRGLFVATGSTPAVGNAILRNAIFSNGDIGIDLAPFEGVTVNDSCDGDVGPNNLQNFPTFTSASVNGMNTALQGNLNSTPDTKFTLEFFSNTQCDPSGFGEGQTFIGSTVVTTDGSCNAGFNVNLPVAVSIGQFITATATDSAGNTSEFSACIAVTAPTAVRLISFTATRYDQGVLLEWKTGFEVDNLGFNLYREEDGKRIAINARLILGSALLGAGTAISGTRSYSLWDKPPRTDEGALYWLEEIDLSGRTAWHGPARLDRAQGIDASPVASGSHSSMPTIFGTNRAGTTEASSKPIEQTASLPQASASQLETQRDLASRPGVKLSVKQEGWYRVTKDELVGTGFGANTDPRLLRMFVDGREIPISVVAWNQADGLPSYAVEFYGIGLDSAVTDARVYWLAEGSIPGARIGQVKPRGQKRAEESFPFTVERKDRNIYFSSLRNGERENFFGAVVAQHSVSQTVVLQNVAQSTRKTALLEVALQGVTDAGHQVSLKLNGVPVGTMVFQGQTEAALALPIPHSLLREGDNEVTLAAESGQTDVSLIDFVRITYRHTFAPDNDALRFTASSKQRVTLEGFSNASIRVVDVTTPDAVEELAGKIRQGKAGYSVALSVPGGGQRKLFAFTGEQVRRPASIAFNRPSIWRQSDHAAELVILSHRDFLGAVEPLRALRASQGMTAAVVDIEDIHDEFSFGHKTPEALRDFLTFAGIRWTVAPRYVLLVGNASYDPKNHLGRGDFDLMPTKLIDTQLMETASDDWFVDFDGDGLGEMAVGRLPADTVGEAAAMISKTTDYERSRQSESVLLVSDSKDGFDFEAASAVLRGLIPASLRTEVIDRGQLDAATARRNLLEAIARGQKIVNYTGHGSATLWRGDLLTSDDATRMENQHLPLFAMMTCLNGYIQDPELDSLAESLMKAERGGAIAVWASSGLTTPDLQATMDQEFFRLILAEGGNAPTLGDATRLAKRSVNDGDVRRTWILFGDPALRLR